MRHQDLRRYMLEACGDQRHLNAKSVLEVRLNRHLKPTAMVSVAHDKLMQGYVARDDEIRNRPIGVMILTTTAPEYRKG